VVLLDLVDDRVVTVILSYPFCSSASSLWQLSRFLGTCGPGIPQVRAQFRPEGCSDKQLRGVCTEKEETAAGQGAAHTHIIMRFWKFEYHLGLTIFFVRGTYSRAADFEKEPVLIFARE
jgi:hypothetical protein